MAASGGNWKGGRFIAAKNTASLSEGARGLLASLPKQFTVADAPGVSRKYRGQLRVTQKGAANFNELVTGGFISATDVIGPRGRIYKRE